MKLFIMVLNKVDKLDELMTEFATHGICGATILDSQGMARELYGSYHGEEEIPFLGSIRAMLNNKSRKTNKTILTVLRDDQVDTIFECVDKIVGDLSDPDSGIMFTMPIDTVRGKGLNKHKEN